MTETELTRMQDRWTRAGMKGPLVMIAIAATLACTACVNVTAPDKPIEINLNINVKQEVVYRLDNEAKTAIQSNPGIF